MCEIFDLLFLYIQQQLVGPEFVMVDPAADDFQSSQEGEVDGHTHSHVSLGYGMDGNPDFQNLIPPPQTRLNIVKTNIGSMQKADIEILESGISIYIAPDLLTNPSRVLFKFLYISVKRISFRPSSIFFPPYFIWDFQTIASGI